MLTDTLTDLACQRCPLWQSRQNVVDGSGRLEPRLMVVGDMPGRSEDKCGMPLVGKAGQLLRSTLAEAGYQTSELFFTHAVRCRGEDGRSATDQERDTCRDWLVAEIEYVKPKAILAVGKLAKEQLSHLEITVPIFYAMSPGFVLRHPERNRQFREEIAATLGLPAIVKTSTSQPYPVGFFAVDTETDDLEEGLGVKMVLASASDGNAAWVYTPDERINFPGVTIFHNAKYDAPLLGFDLRNEARWDDTMLMAYVLRYPRVGLKELVKTLLGHEMVQIKDILTAVDEHRETLKSGRVKVKLRKRKRSFSQALAEDREKAIEYAKADAIWTARLAEFLDGELTSEPTLSSYYGQIEKPVTPIILAMEQEGVRIDRDKLIKLDARLEQKLNHVRADLISATGLAGFNPASGRQIGTLFEMSGWPISERTPNGEVATGKDALLKLAGVENTDQLTPDDSYLHYLIHEVLTFRELSKLRATYCDGLSRALDSESRIHARFNQAVTATGRLSSSEPNLQNIPSRTDLGKEFRKLFIARPQHALVRADYSQLEVRIFAHYTQDPTLLAAYPEQGDEQDVHQGVANAIGIPRKAAKNVLFGAIYGASATKLATVAGVRPDAANDFLQNLKLTMPCLVTWHQEIANQLIHNGGYVETLLGWRNYYPEYFSGVSAWQAAALREAGNLPIQGTGAGIVKRLMIEADKLAGQHDASLVLQVHDEVVYEVPLCAVQEFAYKLAALGRDIGREYLTVPLRLGIEVGLNWGEAEKFPPA